MRRSPAPTCSFQRSGSCVVSRSSPKWCCVLYCPALLWVSVLLCEFFCVSFFLYLKLLSNSIAVSAPADVWATSVPPSHFHFIHVFLFASIKVGTPLLYHTHFSSSDDEDEEERAAEDDDDDQGRARDRGNSITVIAPADVWATSVPPSRLIKPSRPRSAWGTSKLSDGESAIETALDNNNRLRHTHESSEKMVGVEDLKDAAFSPDESYVALVLKDLDAGFRDPLQYERTGLLN